MNATKQKAKILKSVNKQKVLKNMRGFSFSCLTFIFLIGFCKAIGAAKLDERYSWTELDWEFPNEMLKMQALASGTYIPRNGLPVGVERADNRLFVTVPRWRDGKYDLTTEYIKKIELNSFGFFVSKCQSCMFKKVFRVLIC